MEKTSNNIFKLQICKRLLSSLSHASGLRSKFVIQSSGRASAGLKSRAEALFVELEVSASAFLLRGQTV